MNYTQGMMKLRDLLPESELSTYTALRKELEKNLKEDRLFGSTETLRAERAKIIAQFNQLTIQYTTTTFNDLCR